MTNGDAIFYKPELVVDRTVMLSREQTTGFLSQLAEMRFWDLPTKEAQLGMDGAEWVLEGIHAGEYHVVKRWSPQEGAFRDAALSLVGLAELEVKEVY